MGQSGWTVTCVAVGTMTAADGATRIRLDDSGDPELVAEAGTFLAWEGRISKISRLAITTVHWEARTAGVAPALSTRAAPKSNALPTAAAKSPSPCHVAEDRPCVFWRQEGRRCNRSRSSCFVSGHPRPEHSHCIRGFRAK